MKTFDGQSSDLTSLFSQWMEQANQYWAAAFKMPGGELQKVSPDGGQKAQKTDGKDRDENRFDLKGIMESVKAVTDAMTHPETQKSMFSGLQSSPMIITQLAGTAWSVFTDIEKQFSEMLGKSSEYVRIKDFTHLDKEAIDRWAELYDKEFRKFITMPQLGLSRFHQERINQVIDRFNNLQLAMADFLYHLYRPIEKSAARLQETVTKWMAGGGLPEHPKAYYREWIKILEGEYMVLFKSPEYSLCLGKVMMAAQAYDIARREVIEQILRYFSVPTNRDLDDAFKAIHDLKKRVARIEKQLLNRGTKDNT